MEFGTLKPLLATLALPPLSLLLFAFLGLLLATRKKRTGLALITLALALLWLVSCHGMAVWLAHTALPQFSPLTVSAMKAGKVQAIVVLGGGLLPSAPEYGEPQPSATTAARLRYGVWLARNSSLPLAFSGGLGWATDGTLPASEAGVAVRMAEQDYGVMLRWVESKSRDTAENARLLAPMLQRAGISRIALVTDATHMPRAVLAFSRMGLAVAPAPTGYILPERSAIIEWLPTSAGLYASQNVLREYLALLITRLAP